MKLLTSLIFTIVLIAPVLAQTPEPGPTVARAQAQDCLNAAARAYREGDFAAAQAYSERAMQLDPENRTAPMFVARTIHAQYKPGVNTAENVAKAREAIVAYKRILERSPGDDESYKAIAYLYGATKDDAKLKEWITARATSDATDPAKRAEAYVVLASKNWECSFQITELPANKITTVDPSNNKATVSYRKPADQKDFNQAQMCVKQGLAEVENAIKFDPNNENAWSYKTNLLLEASKLAEMEGQTEQKAQYQKDYEAALKRTAELSEAAQKRREEEEKQQAAQPKS